MGLHPITNNHKETQRFPLEKFLPNDLVVQPVFIQTSTGREIKEVAPLASAERCHMLMHKQC